MASPAVQTMKELLDETKIDGSLEGFKFDIDICRKAFDYYDNDRNGVLSVDELFKLADVLWDTFYPQGPKLDESAKGFLVQEILGKTDVNHDSVISFQEFIPWYKAMAQKHWRATHPKQKQKLSAAPPPTQAPAPAVAQPPPARTVLGAGAPKAEGRSAKPLAHMQEYFCTLTQQNYYGLACLCSTPANASV
eukprot:CAMPEP_0196757388 /NCGR_PEP_ID=MMETSP1091-20130531/103637_1 /TAXON_ID=302021 /ORGANISM="Rhodomonas sp., Strain CCMP768" /LENGTH=191 /DNA_ID=CAMNT_0042106161 /DNA_START=81 /DNA_END=656 /DNA_ORIENTATION=+